MRGFSTLVLGALVACGGGSKPEVIEPDEVDEERADGEPGAGEDDDAQLDPDAIDEITRLFAMRRPAVARCYTDAVQAGKLDRKAKGRLTVEVAIDPRGNAKSVRASQDTLDSPELNDCVFALIKSWELPAPQDDFAFTFSYDFEPE